MVIKVSLISSANCVFNSEVLSLTSSMIGFHALTPPGNEWPRPFTFLQQTALSFTSEYRSPFDNWQLTPPFLSVHFRSQNSFRNQRAATRSLPARFPLARGIDQLPAINARPAHSPSLARQGQRLQRREGKPSTALATTEVARSLRRYCRRFASALLRSLHPPGRARALGAMDFDDADLDGDEMYLVYGGDLYDDQLDISPPPTPPPPKRKPVKVDFESEWNSQGWDTGNYGSIVIKRHL